MSFAGLSHAAFQFGHGVAVFHELFLGLRADFADGFEGFFAAPADHVGFPLRVVLRTAPNNSSAFPSFSKAPDEVAAGFQLLGGAGGEVSLEINVRGIELRFRERWTRCLGVDGERQGKAQ